ncbi:hypothetical protein KAR91_64970 [Candidatus Pacearchaeota archaeon]|nr:hypothetical protein [Candidatus Pacearchaeota archaeon]
MNKKFMVFFIFGGAFLLTVSSVSAVGNLHLQARQQIPGGMFFLYNNAPYIPQQPDGPTGGFFDRVWVGHDYTYTTSTTDPDGDRVSYNWSWGDGTYSGWSIFVPSGVVVPKSHNWDETGTYEVKVKAKDIHESESDWSPALIVEVSKSTSSNTMNLNNKILKQVSF